MNRLRFVLKLLAVQIRDRAHHPARLLAETILVAARCGVVLLLYRHVFALRGGTIGGLDYPAAAWSMFLYFALSSLRLRELSFALMDDIRTGRVEVLFSKPVAYLPYRQWWQLGAGLYPAAVVLLVGGTALLVGVGLPPAMHSAAFLPGLAAVAAAGCVLSLLLYTLVGLLAFWMEDIGPVHWVTDKAVMLLGGAYLPVALFPPVLRDLSTYSPFGAAQFVTRTVDAGWPADAARLIGIQLLWIALLGVAVWRLARLARSKVSINGG